MSWRCRRAKDVIAANIDASSSGLIVAMFRVYSFIFFLASFQPSFDNFRWLEIWRRSQAQQQIEIDKANARRVKWESQMCIESLKELRMADDFALLDYVHNTSNRTHEKELKQAMKKIRTWCGIR